MPAHSNHVTHRTDVNGSGNVRLIRCTPNVDDNMSDLTMDTQRNLGRSTLAVIAGFAAIFVLSLGTDQIFHSLALG